jgi:multidrug transporter EmrE-like cation transporter
MNKAVILVFISVVIGTIGQLCIKTAMLRIGPMPFSLLTEIIDSAWQIMRQPLIWLALLFYGAGFIVWASALSHLQLSFAYPLLAAGYLINPLAAMILFNEQIPLIRWIGIVVIMVGIVLVGRS